MRLTDYITVFNNIFKNFSYLKSDFIGINFNVGIFIHFIANIFVATLLMIIYFRIGKKVTMHLFKGSDYKKFINFINITLGYILVNSGLAVLSVFSLLYPVILWTYTGIVVIFAFYPLNKARNFKNEVIELLKLIKNKIKSNKWICLGILLFVVIAFLRLMPPEIGEDAIGYHTGDPHLFLKNHTSIISSKTQYVSMPAPHLGEMSYVISEFVGIKDSARYIHFSFYFLVVLLLTMIGPYSALFFVTAPVVIQISSKANVDFQWILCWLLSILILTQSGTHIKKNIVLIGILFGGVIASKIWTIAFFPLFVLYILIFYKKLRLGDKLNTIFIFLLSALFVDCIWLWRSYAISENPLYPMFSNITNLEGISGMLGIGNVIGFNKLMFQMQNIGVFSPLFLLGIVVFIFHWRYGLRFLRKSNLFIFFAFLVIEYIFIKYHFGRYLLGLYSLAVLAISITINNIVKKYWIYKFIMFAGFSVMFIYYFVNTLLILPYGFGWADNNKYLTRVLIRDNSSYYDFNHLFGKWITSNDKIATYKVYGYYYANFNYIDCNYIFNKDNKSFDLLLRKNVTKLIIKGGDIVSFCQALSLSDCNSGKVKLLANYSEGATTYNLYSILKAH